MHYAGVDRNKDQEEQLLEVPTLLGVPTSRDLAEPAPAVPGTVAE